MAAVYCLSCFVTGSIGQDILVFAGLPVLAATLRVASASVACPHRGACVGPVLAGTKRALYSTAALRGSPTCQASCCR